MELVNQIRERLFALSEPEFQKFSAALIPGEERMLGVRLPALRALAKEIARGVEGKVKTTVFEEEQKEEMTEYLEKLLREGDAVLFKGSNSMKLGETAARFI